MGWWKRMFKESIGNSEVRKSKDEPKDYSDLEVKDYADSIYDDPNPPEEEKPVLCVREGEDLLPVEVFKKIDPLDLNKVNFKASPTRAKRKGEVKYIILHHTGPGNFGGIVNWLCNKDAKASAHYVLGTGAQLKQLVNSKYEAGHAGIARWDGVQINNHYSIGIEICNLGRLEQSDDGSFYYEVGRSTKKYTGKVQPVSGTIVYPNGQAISGFYVPYPEKQLDKLVALCKALVKKYPAITKNNILTHHQVASPIGRKNDPFGLDVESIKNRIFG